MILYNFTANTSENRKQLFNQKGFYLVKYEDADGFINITPAKKSKNRELLSFQHIDALAVCSPPTFKNIPNRPHIIGWVNIDNSQTIHCECYSHQDDEIDGSQTYNEFIWKCQQKDKRPPADE